MGTNWFEGRAMPCRHAVQAEQKQCVQLADSATSVDYQLTLPTSDLAGPGKLTVALEHTPFQASTYLQLTGLATKADIQLSKHQSLHSKLATPASMLKRPAAHPESGLLLTVPSPLLYGSAIQLKAFMHGRVTDIPYYAVSEELLENILPSADFRKVLPLQTPYHGSLPANIGLEVADMLLCPATHSRSNEQHQQDGHWQLPAAPLRQASAPPALSGEQRTPFAWLPWGVSLCLLLCTIASLLKSRQQAARQAAAQHDTSAAQPAAEHEASFVKSNWPGLDPTPTKDTGSSPFVPVTHFQAPVPHWPLDNAHLASCSSKIGSYKQKARPATSKAVTNMTSNVSGATKWQRNKNGRLLSLALDPDEHNS